MRQLAIIIPYYKLIFFEETLQSLANQTDKRFKVYIGDDASPEDCSPLLEKYKGQFDFVYHRFEYNLGGKSLTQQWERCVALSDREKWLMILGDDDVLGQNVVEEFNTNLSEIEGIKSKLVRFATQVINEEGESISAVFKQPKLEKATDAFWRRFKGDTRSSLSEYIFLRASFDEFGFKNYPLAWHSDDMAWLEFSEAKKIYSINNAQIKIGFSNLSISGMNDNWDLKSGASLAFYNDILKMHSQIFSKKERLEILMKYEVLIKQSRKLYKSEWLFLILQYFRNFSMIPFAKLCRRILIAYQ